MSGLTRSVKCILNNNTAATLKLTSKEYTHGSPDTPIPDQIEPLTAAEWATSTAGVFTGTEGSALFEIEGGDASFEVYWNNPFVGTNSFKQVFRLTTDVTSESKFGAYVDSAPVYSEGSDVIVSYTLTMTPPEAKEGGADAGAAQQEAPPPDSKAPQPVAAAPGVDSHASGVGVLTPPRLCVALNAVDPGDPLDDKSLDAILEIMAKRLEGGLDPVWKKAGEAGLWDTTKWKDTDTDEQWARMVTELLLGLPYNGSGAIYGRANQDNIFYKPFSDPSVDPIVPLAAACQHNATIGVLGRGFSLDDLAGTGFSCLNANTMKCFKGGSYFVHKDEQKDIATAIEGGLVPGSVYVFNPDEKAKRAFEGAHIAFILRVDKDQKKAQFFDTGGLQHPDRVGGKDPVIMQDFKAKGSYDDPLWDKVTTKFYIGVGNPNPGKPDIARLKKARPIGLARLVIVARGAKFADKIDPASPPADLKFVSRLLRTYGDADSHNFTVARYYWSLRKLPDSENLQAYWVFYAPIDGILGAKATAAQKAQARAATNMIGAPRTKKVDELGVPLNRKQYFVLSDTADGQAKQVQRSYTKTEKNDPGSTEQAQPKEIVEPAGAFPPNLVAFINKLAPSQGFPATGGPALPPLFQDYATAAPPAAKAEADPQDPPAQAPA